MSARNPFRTLCLLAIVAGMLPLLARAATGDLMRVTSTFKMQMTGVPAQYANAPARTLTRQECVAGNRQLRDPQRWVEDSDCTVSALHSSARVVSAHLVCKQTTADIRIDLLPGGGAHGTVHMSGSVGQGMHTVGDQTIDARRIGSCNYPPHATAH
jgi:Protein of unknown function (DUF3617)